jgi:hypothetical protein
MAERMEQFPRVCGVTLQFLGRDFGTLAYYFVPQSMPATSALTELN